MFLAISLYSVNIVELTSGFPGREIIRLTLQGIAAVTSGFPGCVVHHVLPHGDDGGFFVVVICAGEGVSLSVLRGARPKCDGAAARVP